MVCTQNVHFSTSGMTGICNDSEQMVDSSDFHQSAWSYICFKDSKCSSIQ